MVRSKGLAGRAQVVVNREGHHYCRRAGPNQIHCSVSLTDITPYYTGGTSDLMINGLDSLTIPCLIRCKAIHDGKNGKTKSGSHGHPGHTPPVSSISPVVKHDDWDSVRRTRWNMVKPEHVARFRSSRRAAKDVQGGVASNTACEDQSSYSVALGTSLDMIQHDWRTEGGDWHWLIGDTSSHSGLK